jgi:glycosyltransferase involved in cell wall biosynthesis
MPRVAVLLATHQGERFLRAQLDSIERAAGSDWFVRASDDGSTDGTLDILAAYRNRWGASRLAIGAGPCLGPNANFLSLVGQEDIEADVFAFADQDDEWEADKLARAAGWIGTVDPGVPALYTSRTRLIDASGRDIGMSPLFRRPPSFANALTQNLASGNTMVFNRAARHLLQATREAAAGSVMHDWWTYLIVSGAGGPVRYDPEPTVRYRQHGANQFGGGASLTARAAGTLELFGGRLRAWTDRNVSALDRARDHLTDENRIRLDQFAAARRSSLADRLAGLRRAGVYRQTARGNVLIWTAAVLNRL